MPSPQQHLSSPTCVRLKTGRHRTIGSKGEESDVGDFRALAKIDVGQLGTAYSLQSIQRCVSEFMVSAMAAGGLAAFSPFSGVWQSSWLVRWQPGGACGLQRLDANYSANQSEE